MVKTANLLISLTPTCPDRNKGMIPEKENGADTQPRMERPVTPA